MDDHDLSWRLLPIVAILLVGAALLFPACADKESGVADFYRQLERQSGGGTQ